MWSTGGRYSGWEALLACIRRDLCRRCISTIVRRLYLLAGRFISERSWGWLFQAGNGFSCNPNSFLFEFLIVYETFLITEPLPAPNATIIPWPVNGTHSNAVPVNAECLQSSLR